MFLYVNQLVICYAAWLLKSDLVTLSWLHNKQLVFWNPTQVMWLFLMQTIT